MTNKTQFRSFYALFCTFCASLWLKNPRNLRNPWLINDLRAFGISTTVECALQIKLFMQNEPKFRKVKLNVNNVLTKDYDQLDTWSIRKNEPKTNPKRTQIQKGQNERNVLHNKGI